MSDDHESDAVRQEKEMREHEREARERSEDERDPMGTPDGDANPAPPGNVQGGNLGGAS
jgi:hypothetical protein